MFNILYKRTSILTMLAGYLIFRKQKYMSTRWSMTERQNQERSVSSSATLGIGRITPIGNSIQLLRISGSVLMRLESWKAFFLKSGSFHYQDTLEAIVLLQ